MHSKLRTVALACAVFVASAVSLVGCGSDSETKSAKPKSPKADATLQIEVGEMYIKPASASFPAGNIKLEVTNKGSIVHEVVALRTDTPFDKLEVKDNRVSEADSVGEVGDIDGGVTKSKVLKLAPGTYVLVCNIPGHYAAGMRAPLTVT